MQRKPHLKSGLSMPVIMLISVDLPLPDLPTTAMNSPSSTCMSIPLRARNLPAPTSYAFVTPFKLDQPALSDGQLCASGEGTVMVAHLSYHASCSLSFIDS